MGEARKFFNRDDPFLIQFHLLTIVGLWYVDSDDKRLRRHYAAYKFLSVFCLTTLLLIEAIDIVMLKEDLSKLAERLCAAATTCIITGRAYLMLKYNHRFYQLQEKLCLFRKMKASDPEDLQIIRKSSARTVLFAKMIYLGAVFAVFFWSFNPQFYGGQKLPLPVRLPIDVQQSPYYEILYVYLTLMLIVHAASVVATVLGFESYSTMINSHFEVLRRGIQNIHTHSSEVSGCTKNDSRKTMDGLINAIETQKFIFDEVDSFRKLHGKHLLIHMVGIIFGIVVVETTGLTDIFSIQLIKRILIFGLGIFDIFLLCFVGEELEYRSCEIGDVLYMIPWHEMDIRVQKVILTMIIRSRRPCVVKAGGMIRLNLATFLNIMRVAYNFMVLLRHTVVRNT